MKENLYQYLLTQSGTLTLREIVMGFVAAAVIAVVNFALYTVPEWENW